MDSKSPSPPSKHKAGEVGNSIEAFLWDAVGNEEALRTVVLSIFRACEEISLHLRLDPGDFKKGTQNHFGDDQLSADVAADKIIFEKLEATKCVSTASSEEKPELISLGGKGYSVAFDPLDGSSIIGTNFSVGTIFGVWPGNKLIGACGKEIKAAGMAVYGPRTTLTLAVDGAKGSFEFMLVRKGKEETGCWVMTKKFLEIKEARLFAPGNLRATGDNPGYARLFNYWQRNAYQLRYTGGMVPDVNQLLIKGKGIFVNPASQKHKAKLRLLYEAAPIAYIIEKSGGRSSDGDQSLLDVKVSDTQERIQVAYGSAGEVQRFEDLVGKKYLRSTL